MFITQRFSQMTNTTVMFVYNKINLQFTVVYANVRYSILSTYNISMKRNLQVSINKDVNKSTAGNLLNKLLDLNLIEYIFRYGSCSGRT